MPTDASTSTQETSLTSTTPTYQSIADTARMLDVSERTVRRRIADGTIKARRFGPRLIRVSVASVHEAMA